MQSISSGADREGSFNYLFGEKIGLDGGDLVVRADKEVSRKFWGWIESFVVLLVWFVVCEKCPVGGNFSEGSAGGIKGFKEGF